MIAPVMHRAVLALSTCLAASASAQVVPLAVPAVPVQRVVIPVTPTVPLVPAPAWNPGADYVTAGQDEPGYRAWYLSAPTRAGQVRAFNDYLATFQVSGVVPTWQLLRTASSWQRCGATPFEVPPTDAWPHIVQTLRYVRDFVVPTVGPVEPVSAYRNPALNHCAGGAAESAHRHFLAVDLVPLRPIARETLMERLCAVHVQRGGEYQVGLGFYAFHRFHVDSMRYRKWGAVARHANSPCATPLPVPAHALPVTTVAAAPQPAAPAIPATPTTTTVVPTVPAVPVVPATPVVTGPAPVDPAPAPVEASPNIR